MRTVATVHYCLLPQDEKQECTAKEAYEWTDGRAMFLGGALEGAVELADGTIRVPRNSHPVYIYPGLMYGLRLCAAQQLRDDMLLAAAESLASQVTDEDRAVGAVYPSMKNIRAISVRCGDGFRCAHARNPPHSRQTQISCCRTPSQGPLSSLSYSPLHMDCRRRWRRQWHPRHTSSGWHAPCRCRATC
jgi:hypothetical protein